MGFCPYCEHETKLVEINSTEYWEHKEESIPVSVKYYYCFECGKTFDTPDRNYDPVEKFYYEYKRRKQNGNN